MYILTLDLGTTFFKSCLFDSFELIGIASAKTPIKTPAPGRVEIDALEFRQTVKKLFGELRKNYPKEFTNISRISFATQANSFLLLDKNDKPLTPIILWTDMRGKDYLPSIASMYEDSDLYSIAGVKSISAQMMPSKLVWIKNMKKGAWNSAARFCSISDYFVYWITGEHISEAGAAGLSAMVDIHNLKWTKQSIAALGLEHIKLPKIVRAGFLAGKIRSKIATSFGLNKKCEFITGCLDQYAGAIGAGNTKAGALSETTGTVMATVSMASGFDKKLQDSGVIQGASFKEGEFYRMVAGSISANLIEEFKNKFAPDLNYKQLDDLALAVFNGKQSGDIKLGKDLLSIYKRIAAALAGQVEKVRADDTFKQIVCVGGAAASDLLLQCKANELGITTIALDCAQPTSLGAAILAHLDIFPIESVKLTKVRARFNPL